MFKLKQKKDKGEKRYPVKTKQIGLDFETYSILTAVKNQLIKKYKYSRAITYSDAVRELQRRSKNDNKNK